MRLGGTKLPLDLPKRGRPSPRNERLRRESANTYWAGGVMRRTGLCVWRNSDHTHKVGTQILTSDELIRLAQRVMDKRTKPPFSKPTTKEKSVGPETHRHKEKQSDLFQGEAP